jgi:hypothetical protein
MRQAFTQRGQDRDISDSVIDSDRVRSPIIGRSSAPGYMKS